MVAGQQGKNEMTKVMGQEMPLRRESVWDLVYCGTGSLTRSGGLKGRWLSPSEIRGQGLDLSKSSDIQPRFLRSLPAPDSDKHTPPDPPNCHSSAIHGRRIPPARPDQRA